MPTSLISTGVQFPDNSIQTTAAGASGGDYVMLAYVSPTTWTKPAGLKAVKVTVVGAGGNGGSSSATPAGGNSGISGGGGGGGAVILYLDAPAIPGSPITVTAGPGTNSFGPLASATVGGNGGNGTAGGFNGAGGAGGTGTIPSPAPSGAIAFTGTPGLGVPIAVPQIAGMGGSSQLFYAQNMRAAVPSTAGAPNPFYGGGGAGAGIATPTTTPRAGGAGGPGLVIIEEFY